MPLALLACLLLLIGLGIAERVARRHAWRAVAIRVHVNGSRGKSTVTRLIWSALRESGIPAIAKTTGTAARILLPDGTERPLTRRAPASIREQLAFLRRARRSGATAAVIECMALEPELQWVSERNMVRATVGVITNVRLDHTEIMGADLESIASTLANTIPRGAVLVSGDDRFLSTFAQRAARLGTRVVGTSDARQELSERFPGEAAWRLDDLAAALTATRELGLDDDGALRGFLAAPADPGAASGGTLDIHGRPLHWFDASAANDPESLEALLADGDGRAASGAISASRLVVYNHRDDRGARLLCFAANSHAVAAADRVIVTGARPPWSAWRALARARGTRPLEFVRARSLARYVREQPAHTHVVFCGNTRGLDLGRLLREAAADG